MDSKLKTTVFAGQDAAIKRYGDKLWEEICDTYRVGEFFTLDRIVAESQTLAHLAPTSRKQIARAVLRNVEEEYEDPLMDGIRCPLARMNRAVWVLVK